MSLKDASAYNIQFRGGRPVLIDTLSFERYREGEPWVAYRQFCQHFLAPLALMSHTDVRLSQLLRVYIDGIPLDLASRLLPVKDPSQSRPRHAHPSARPGSAASTPTSRSSRPATDEPHGVPRLIDNLESTIKKL